MLTINIQDKEIYDELIEEFRIIKGKKILLEHSLVSISKWEALWEKPFLNNKEKTREESLSYIKCMTITPNIDDSIYLGLTNDNIQTIESYISSKQTATIIKKQNDKKSSKGGVTSELIYYWMIALNIPSEYQKWHLNRLLTLINICNIKNSPPKKRSKGEMMSRNRALNQQRRNAYKTKG